MWLLKSLKLNKKKNLKKKKKLLNRFENGSAFRYSRRSPSTLSPSTLVKIFEIKRKKNKKKKIAKLI